MRVLLRVDAGAEFGLGHFTRSLALAQALRQSHAACTFLTTPKAQARVEQAGCDFVSLDAVAPGSQADLEKTCATAREKQCAVVVVDSYRIGADFLAGLRAANLYVVMIDDLAAFPFPCHMVVNGSIYADAKKYISAKGDTQFLLGAEYILLREEFWNVAPPLLKQRVQNILLLLGGSDALNLMPRLIQELDPLKGDFQITAVMGPFFENRNEVEHAAANAQRRVELAVNPTEQRKLILNADLAISAGGQTIHELLVCGCPTLALAIAENQVPNVHGWAERGAVRAVAGTGRDISFEDISCQTQDLLESYEMRSSLRANGRRWIDGLGARRVAEAILKWN